MKRLVLWVFILGSISNGQTQGTINFDNYVAGVVDAPVSDAAGSRIIGPGPYLADLFWSADLQAPADALLPAGYNTPFSSTTMNGGGYFFGGLKVLPGGGAQQWLVQVRVWDATGGLSYQAAQASGREFGFSDLLMLTSVSPGGDLVGLKPFQLQVIPEPSVLALALAGGGMLWARRKTRTGAR